MRSRWPATSSWGLGCAPLAGLYTAVGEDQARATVDAAWDSGVRYFDTAPHYGAGVSEERLGRALADRPRDAFVLSTKVGRLLVDSDPGEPLFAGEPPRRRVRDYSADGVRRCLTESLERLGMDRIDVVYVHDPEEHWQQAVDEAIPALVELRDAGMIDAIGAGMNEWQMLTRFVTETDVDAVMVAGRWTLLDRSGVPLLDAARANGVAVICAGVLNSGILADPVGSPTFDYEPAGDEVRGRVRHLEQRCAAFDVPLMAAALQFPLRHPAVASVVVGARSPAEVAEQAELREHPVPAQLWAEFDDPDVAVRASASGSGD